MSTATYRVADRAQADLDEIWTLIAQNNPEAADHLLDQFERAFRQLARHPMIGRSRPEFGPQMRSFPVGNYLIFHRRRENCLEIARVLHGARNLKELFE